MTMNRSEAPKIGSQKIDSIVSRYPDNKDRYTVYGIALAQIPEDELARAGRVIEVGMNDILFAFAELFPKETRFFGLTLHEEHQKAARAAARIACRSVDIRLQNLKDGIPEGWQNADLAIDIVGAAHHWDFDKTVQILAQSLRAGGYLLVVHGDRYNNAEDATKSGRDNSQSHRLKFLEEVGFVDIISFLIYNGRGIVARKS